MSEYIARAQAVALQLDTNFMLVLIGALLFLILIGIWRSNRHNKKILKKISCLDSVNFDPRLLADEDILNRSQYVRNFILLSQLDEEKIDRITDIAQTLSHSEIVEVLPRLGNLKSVIESIEELSAKGEEVQRVVEISRMMQGISSFDATICKGIDGDFVDAIELMEDVKVKNVAKFVEVIKLLSSEGKFNREFLDSLPDEDDISSLVELAECEEEIFTAVNVLLKIQNLASAKDA